MSLPKKQLQQIKEELDNCQNPLYFFHDDPDGLCSFLQMYRYKKEGKGVIVKSTPRIDEKFLRKVEEYSPDKVFILDIAMVDQEFINQVNVPIIWIDHHQPLERKGVKYFNPKLNDNSNCIAQVIYDVLKQDMWIAAVGIVGDWFLPSFRKKFSEKYPDLLAEDVDTPEQALFETKIGELVKILGFNLMGPMKKVMQSIKVLTRIDDPYEILNQTTEQGKFIYKRFHEINDIYEKIYKKAMKEKPKNGFYVFVYDDIKLSITKDLANYFLYKYPDKIIIIGRRKDDEVKMSLRSKGKKILPILEKALVGLEAHGGGHDNACGACVKKQDFNKFVAHFKELSL